jgi:hypothetical protein
LLFDEAELRAMAERLELKAAGPGVVAVSMGSGPLQELSLYERAPALGVRDIAKALADPQMYSRAIRLQNPRPDDHAIEDLARFHLECGDVAGALRLLEEPWDGYRDIARLDLLDRAYGQNGETALRIETRRRRYQRLPCLWTYRALEELLDEAARGELREQVSAEAVGLRDVATAAELLLATGAAPQAQVLLLARAKELDHAAAYLISLRRVAGRVNDYRNLPTHAEYEAQVRARHARKTGFWRQVTVRSL